MKVLWIIKRKDGSVDKFVKEVGAKPIPGDGAEVDGILVEVGSMVSTPMSADLEMHDIAVTAREQ